VRLAPPDDQPLAREAVFEFIINERHAYSYVWITGVARNFIKLRFSVDAGLKDEVPDARRAILTAFGDAVRPYLAPAAAPTEEKKEPDNGTTITINSQGGSQEDVTTAMMYLMFVSARADKDPSAAPPCGGTIIPSFATELSVFQAMRDSDTTNKSAFGQKLLAISNAGFLEEFVWVDRHREPWGADPPEGLKLADFKNWRKKNLKKFNAPDFGSVGVKQMRVLPIEDPAAP